MVWLLRIADRRHVTLVPALWLAVSLGYFWLIVSVTTGKSWAWETPEEIWGSILVYCLVPAYLLVCAPFMWRRSENAIGQLALLVSDPESARRRVLEVPTRLIVGGVVAGVVFGVSQYTQLLVMIRQSANPWLDLSLMLANTLLWATVGWVLAWRLYAGSGFCALGYRVRVDLYNPALLRPLARVAVLDLLVVMGTLALMPIQSLDFQFRWSNYEAGLIVALPSAFVFFLLPLWGAHRAIVLTRQQRLEELQIALNECSKDNIPELDALVAHRHRVQGFSTWPLDVKILLRVLFYLVIPPLAWVGAALVENLVEALVG